MVDEALFARWREAAASSLREVPLLADAGEHRHACQHAEQAAHVALKGFLHAVGAGAQARGHDLAVLAEAVGSTSGTEPPDAVRDALNALSRHYVPPDHPDALHGSGRAHAYQASDAAQALADANAVLRFVDGAWSRLVDAAAG